MDVAAAGATEEAQDIDGEEEEAAVQGEQAGKDTYKRVQASSAAAVQRQKAARTQVALSSACGLRAMPMAMGIQLCLWLRAYSYVYGLDCSAYSCLHHLLHVSRQYSYFCSVTFSHAHV